MLEHRPRSNPKRKTQDGYKLRRAAYSAAAAHSHELQCSLFGKKYEPVPDIRQRLDAQLKTHTINQMKQEIDELNGGGDDGRG